MNVAEQWPAHTDRNGVTWYRPNRDNSLDFSQWGWTSQREQAHPDYVAQMDAQTGGLHPEGLCGGDCTGCCNEAEGGGRDGSSALDAAQDRLPLSRSWNLDEQGRTLCGAFVCGTCDGGGCFDCSE